MRRRRFLFARGLEQMNTTGQATASCLVQRPLGIGVVIGRPPQFVVQIDDSLERPVGGRP